MNCIPKIAEMLGVELGEEFKIDSSGKSQNNYRFTADGLFFQMPRHDEWLPVAGSTLLRLIYGQTEIIKICRDKEQEI